MLNQVEHNPAIAIEAQIQVMPNAANPQVIHNEAAILISQSSCNYNESEESGLSEIKGDHTFTISREGLRLLHKRRVNNNMSMMSLNRVRKTDEQVNILMKLFELHNGKVTRKLRKEAEKRTGLAWIQIYKWIFDKKARQNQVIVDRLYNYPVPIFRVIGKDGRDLSKPRPIFKLERFPTNQAAKTTGKPEVL